MPFTSATEPTLNTSKKPSKLRRTIPALVTMGAWIAAVFASAGRWDWIGGWVCMMAYVISMTAAAVVVARTNPVVIQAREKWRHADTKRFDKIILSIYLPLTFLQPAIAGLDAVRFGWSSMPFWTVYAGAALFLFAMIPVIWAMMVNPHAETTVRIQSERGHKTVSSGPYRIVRHPMYVGAILLYPATALMLGSMWAMAIAAVITVLLVVRTALEDRTLQRELPGYEEFSTHTRYRLIPGVW